MKIGQVEITKEDFETARWIVAEAFGRLHVPKNIKNRIGIVIAIKTENDYEKNRLRNDLIQELHQSLQASQIAELFNVIEFPQQLAEKINDHQKALLYLKRARGHLIVHGQLVQRDIDNKQNHVFKLFGLVRHRPVSHEVHDQFTKEFNELLPNRYSFPEDKEVLGFEFTNQWLSQVIKYIIAIAAFISGDINLAYRIFSELKEEVDRLPHSDSVPILSEIKKRIPIRLVEVISVILQRQNFIYTHSRDKQQLMTAESYVQEILAIDPTNYQGLLLQAIIDFFRNDIDKAIHEFDGMNVNDATWHYSLGFLLAYQGDIIGALEHYRKTFYLETSANVVNDIDIFITEVLQERPEKIQLYFFRGEINYKAKPDYTLAKQDFETFLQNSQSSQYPQLVTLAKKYLSEIELHLGR
ncbi:MAG: hypothetical protein V1907_04640 [Candidatus Kerfeldbacteria bacterium]